MARRSNRGTRIQPAQLDLAFTIPAGVVSGDSRSYIDTARELSKVNRRGYSQGRMYAYQGLSFIWRQNTVGAKPMTTLELSVRTAGNTWVVQNAHVKGEALWHQMQDLVLDDNPSLAGKWHDFKVRLSSEQVVARQLLVKDGAGVDVKSGEWKVSTYVMPQHEVNPATGLPLAADEFTACLVGANTATIKSLTQAYEDSRATVQSPMPNVPAGVSTSFFNLLTDTGSQEPELADVIIDENDEPPYDLSEDGDWCEPLEAARVYLGITSGVQQTVIIDVPFGLCEILAINSYVDGGANQTNGVDWKVEVLDIFPMGAE